MRVGGSLHDVGPGRLPPGCPGNGAFISGGCGGVNVLKLQARETPLGYRRPRHKCAAQGWHRHALMLQDSCKTRKLCVGGYLKDALTHLGSGLVGVALAEPVLIAFIDLGEFAAVFF